MIEGLNFIAIDFETATGKRASICEVGICVVRNGEITELVLVLCSQKTICTAIGICNVMVSHLKTLKTAPLFQKFGRK